MKILFMGTPEFAVPCLSRMAEAGFDVCGVFTQPDRPKGRGKKLTPPPVKEMALKLGIKVYQPNSLKDEKTIDIISSLNPDLIVVTAYGKILPRAILDYPKHGCINIHASLLPKYRGAAPIQWAIINGEKVTGITSMYMAKGLDTGDMILKTETKIGDTETFGELYSRLSIMGAQNLIDTIRLIQQGKAPREKQDDLKSCYAPMIDNKVCTIDWQKEPQSVCNLIRGLSPAPAAMTRYKGKRIKLFDGIVCKLNKNGNCGEVLGTDDKGNLIVACKAGAVVIRQIKGDSGKLMPMPDYLRGHPIAVGTILGKEEE